MIIPFGTDRADGLVTSLGQMPGTPDPINARFVEPSEVFFEELPDSPKFEFGEKATCSHSFKCDISTMLTIVTAPSPYYRGQVVLDSAGNKWKILSVNVDYQRPKYAIVTIVSQAVSFGLPPDEFHIEVLEFNPALQKHPRYSGIDRTLIQALTQDALLGSTASAKLAAMAQIDALYGAHGTSPNQVLWTAAWELVTKLLRGEETFYLAGFHVMWSRYSANSPLIDPGGRIEDPITGGLPVQFWSDTGQPGGNNVFTALAALVSPQFYKQGISWLRQADTTEYDFVVYKQTHHWIGGPAGGTMGNGFYFLGQWDLDIYNPTFDPNNPVNNYGVYEKLVDPTWPGENWADVPAS